MQFFKTLLIAAMSTNLALASDVCPPTYCTIGERCGYDPNGKHCCGANNGRNVVSLVEPRLTKSSNVQLMIGQLQCVNGKWALRNQCNTNQFCTCTGSKDLVCKNKWENVGYELQMASEWMTWMCLFQYCQNESFYNMKENATIRDSFQEAQ